MNKQRIDEMTTDERNGKGSEREAALMGENERLRKALLILADDTYNWVDDCGGQLSYNEWVLHKAQDALNQKGDYMTDEEWSARYMEEENKIRARLQSCSPSGWQPIETAPRDGTDVDLWVVHRQSKISFREIDAYFSGGEWWNDAGEQVSRYASPTHWMPIPAPPVQSCAGEVE